MGDEVNLLEEGDWYGHPNVARYREDPVKNSHEAAWYSQLKTEREEMKSGVTYQPPITYYTSPVEGMEYYRSDAFGGSARGDLFLAYYK